MKDRKSVQVIRHYFKTVIGNAVKMKETFGEESIHLFRVDVKKLRAFLRLLRAADKNSEHMKFPRDFKLMYALTGKIRDRQLILKRLRSHPLFYHFSSGINVRSLIEEIKECSREKKAFPGKKRLDQIKQDILDTPTIGSAPKLIKDFFAQKLQAISDILVKGNFRDASLHTIRKCIKDIIYITRIFKDDLREPIPFNFWSEGEFKNAERISRQLGLFNDCCVSLAYLSTARIKNATSPENEHLTTIRKQWLVEKRRLKQGILHDLPAIDVVLLLSG